MVSTFFTGAYQIHRQTCGCADWMQFKDGQWAAKFWRCLRHEVIPPRDTMRPG
jgi:hypothetical protein